MNATMRWFASQHAQLITSRKVITALIARAFLLRFLYLWTVVNFMILYKMAYQHLYRQSNRKIKWNRAIGHLHVGAYVSGVVRAFNVHRQADHSTDADSSFDPIHGATIHSSGPSSGWTHAVDIVDFRLWPLSHSMVCCKYAMKMTI